MNGRFFLSPSLSLSLSLSLFLAFSFSLSLFLSLPIFLSFLHPGVLCSTETPPPLIATLPASLTHSLILFETGIELELSGDEGYYTNPSLLHESFDITSKEYAV